MVKDLKYWNDRRSKLFEASDLANSEQYLILKRGIEICEQEIEYFLQNSVNDEIVNNTLTSLNKSKPKKRVKKHG
jgi:hypothetical protein